MYRLLNLVPSRSFSLDAGIFPPPVSADRATFDPVPFRKEVMLLAAPSQGSAVERSSYNFAFDQRDEPIPQYV